MRRQNEIGLSERRVLGKAQVLTLVALLYPACTTAPRPPAPPQPAPIADPPAPQHEPDEQSDVSTPAILPSDALGPGRRFVYVEVGDVELPVGIADATGDGVPDIIVRGDGVYTAVGAQQALLSSVGEAPDLLAPPDKWQEIVAGRVSGGKEPDRLRHVDEPTDRIALVSAAGELLGSTRIKEYAWSDPRPRVVALGDLDGDGGDEILLADDEHTPAGRRPTWPEPGGAWIVASSAWKRNIVLPKGAWADFRCQGGGLGMVVERVGGVLLVGWYASESGPLHVAKVALSSLSGGHHRLEPELVVEPATTATWGAALDGKPVWAAAGHWLNEGAGDLRIGAANALRSLALPDESQVEVGIDALRSIDMDGDGVLDLVVQQERRPIATRNASDAAGAKADGDPLRPPRRSRVYILFGS